MTRCFRLLSVLVSLVLVQETPADTAAVEFRDGDRVILIGNTFIERAQTHGHLEVWLTAAYPDRDLTFRNLGWSGDTVFGHARSYFGPPAEGLERLAGHLEELQPTLILSAYGAVAAYEGESGIESFREGYGKLLDLFEKTGARIVLMSPPPAEEMPEPLPSLAEHQARLARYTEVIAALAEERSYPFADVYHTLQSAWPALPHPLTDNGLHFTDAGYAAITPLVTEALGVVPPGLSIEVDAGSGETLLEGARVEAVAAGPEAVTLRVVPGTAVPRSLKLVVTGLAEGDYVIASQRPWMRAGAEDLARGVEIPAVQWNASLEALRRAVLKKNELFFHRWRPQNETYLFGFRKHEQGNNAVEIPQFEPLIAEQEARIRELKQPAPFTLYLKRSR